MAYITDINIATPAFNDPVGSGDDQIRAFKTDVKQSFPNISGAVTATHTELNKMDGVTATTAELNILDGVTATATELNKLDGCTASTSELNKVDGLTATTTELNYVDGVISAIQTQLNARAALSGSTGQAFSIAAPSTTTQAIRQTTYANTNGQVGGTVKMRVSGNTLYIRNDGTNA